MSQTINSKIYELRDWLWKSTELPAIAGRLTDIPSAGWTAWARTTAGVVALLFVIQLLTGVLMAFHYVPSIETAHVTVAYLEKVVPLGAWIRSLHFHTSVWLPVALVLHIAQLILRNAYLRLSPAWAVSLVLLGLVLAAGATGFALPWDARSYNGVHVAVSLAGNTPLIGAAAQTWMQNGAEISTLTLSRFYGLHVFVLPAILLLVAALRIFVLRHRRAELDQKGQAVWMQQQLVRNSIVIGLVFLFAAYYAAKYHAPFAPTPAEAANFLPRPGPQFLWLFEMQKYLQGMLASVMAVAFPGMIIGGLFMIPVLAKLNLVPGLSRNHRLVVSAIFLFGFATVVALTGLAVYQDVRDPRIQSQLAKQTKEEQDFRSAPFKPRLIQSVTNNPAKTAPQPGAIAGPQPKDQVALLPTPKSYQLQCAKCHGASGEGVSAYPGLGGLTTRAEEPRTSEDILAIINNPSSFALSSKMRSYKDKLTEAEKQEIVQWILTLK